MATILVFPTLKEQKTAQHQKYDALDPNISDPLIKQQSAEIIIFSGVRIERYDTQNPIKYKNNTRTERLYQG